MSHPLVRVDVWSLAPTDLVLTHYADAVAAMKAKPATDPTSWSYQAAIHGSLVASPPPEWNQCRHGSWYFVSWHRMYLYFFERIVRAQVVALGGPKTWALPFWNYDGGGTHKTLPLAFRSQKRPDGSANPLYVQQRNTGINTGAGLPSSITSPAFALGRPTFTGASEFGGGVTSALGQFWSQTGRLEQTPHNDVHVAIGGLMGDPDSAALDPIFWLHHANIDRLWWLWQGQKPHTDPTQSTWTTPTFDFKDAGGVTVSMTSADVENTEKQLGYTYTPQKHLAAHAPVKRQLPAPWPYPWPDRGTAERSISQAGLEVTPSLVGATERPVRLVGQTLRASIVIDERATQPMRSLPRAAENQRRAFLDIEDIEAVRNPGTVYGVFVNLPDQASEETLNAHHVGNLSLFGVERARTPRGDEHGHGLRLSMEITDWLDRFAEDGTWHDGTRLDVTFRPVALEAPPDQPALARDLAPAAHPDVPITIGRISVRFA